MRVLQLIDSLQTGGAERMAVNYANALVHYIEKSFLCTTREEGPLLKVLHTEVGYRFLNRRKTLDFKALFKLKRYVKEQQIDIIHAHGTSFFIAALLKLIYADCIVVWHNHSFEDKNLNFLQRIALRSSISSFHTLLSVNENLNRWAQNTLKHKRAYYIKNFVIPPSEDISDHNPFPGIKGKRIVCVANLRPVKNHGMLLDAFNMLLPKFPEATLHLFGSQNNDIYAQSILAIAEHDVENVYYHGVNDQMDAILPFFDIGVLSSDSEGLPLALLEYGQAGLPVVVTNVGQCKKVLNGLDGCIEVGDTEAFVEKISEYLENFEAAKKTGSAFQRQILAYYGRDVILPEVISIYEEALNKI
ncbi:glycosyltransferase family 4 protein [Flavimarina sp. Hel_I_48]|uniref:glycosyltransferase family 4 protein n=1 Tax=Flavimarina sp. Hel_I_48 TaxID=1392488 RepID=UPI0006902193|nr:glycosyltransferase family 4 protein [Flavimarina sp. Hel_I_48]